MAYNSSELSVLSYTNGFSLWHYRTEDELAVVKSPGYFDGAWRMLRTGDFIFVNASSSTGEQVFVTLSKENVVNIQKV